MDLFSFSIDNTAVELPQTTHLELLFFLVIYVTLKYTDCLEDSLAYPQQN